MTAAVATRRKAAPRWEATLGRMFARDVTHMTRVLVAELVPSLEDLADTCAAEYLSRVDEHGNVKALTDVLERLVNSILAAVSFSRWADQHLKARLDRHYRRVGRRTVETLNTALDLDMLLTEASMNKLGQVGATRRHLIGVETDARRALQRAIADGTDAGDNPLTVAQRIRDEIPKGRYVNAGAKYRAQLIARTETLTAQRIASLDAYEDSPVVGGAKALDGDSDEACAARNGQVFTIEAARREEEHPNGTLTWLPALISP